MKSFQSLHHNKSLGLLVLRIVVGFIFIVHGYMKLGDMTGTIGFFATLGLAPFWAYVVALVEFLGGISLVIGYATKIGASLLAINMLVAVLDVHKSYGLVGPMGAELALVMFASTLCIAVAGAGRYSLGACCGFPSKNGTCPVGGNCGSEDCCKK